MLKLVFDFCPFLDAFSPCGCSGQISKWEKKIGAKDEELKQRNKPSDKIRSNVSSGGEGGSGVRMKVRDGAGTVPIKSGAAATSTAPDSHSPMLPPNQPFENRPKASTLDNRVDKQASAAAHTYDVGYKKWERFDIDAALQADDETVPSTSSSIIAKGNQNNLSHPQSNISVPRELADGDIEPMDYSGVETTNRSTNVAVAADPAVNRTMHTISLTPATLANQAMPVLKPAPAGSVPKARGVYNDRDTETAERERGNIEYQKGNFNAAVKAYTKCLGLKSNNYVAFSNRAMAYLKMKEFVRAEQDCSVALGILPSHAKSLQRRATARNALGKHRGALQVCDINLLLFFLPPYPFFWNISPMSRESADAIVYWTFSCFALSPI